MDMLANYRNLIAKVDELCGGILARLGERIVCREGCASCCTHLSLFPVEAAALKKALAAVPPVVRQRIRAAAGLTGEECPLLEADRCLLYEARPVICRTHGLPVLVRENDSARVDLCSLNGQGMESLQPVDIVDLERLNALLAAINALYVQQAGGGQQRVPMASVLSEAE